MAVLGHWFVPGAQASADSLQVSSPLQATPSSHERGAPTQLPASHRSSMVQSAPSSQATPVAGLKLVVDSSGSQTSQSFAGFRVFSA
jgi:hypothetical protein